MDETVRLPAEPAAAPPPLGVGFARRALIAAGEAMRRRGERSLASLPTGTLVGPAPNDGTPVVVFEGEADAVIVCGRFKRVWTDERGRQIADVELLPAGVDYWVSKMIADRLIPPARRTFLGDRYRSGRERGHAAPTPAELYGRVPAPPGGESSSPAAWADEYAATFMVKSGVFPAAAWADLPAAAADAPVVVGGA